MSLRLTAGAALVGLGLSLWSLRDLMDPPPPAPEALAPLGAPFAPAPPPAAAAPLALEALEALEERPLFQPGRRFPAPPPPPEPEPEAAAPDAEPEPPPPEPEPEPALEPEPPPPPPELMLVLKGVVLAGEESLALVLDPAAQKPVRLRKGESLNGWRLEKIMARGALFSQDQIERLLEFPAARPASAPEDEARKPPQE